MTEEQHARLGPSNHRWPNCPGSVRMEAPYPDVAGAAAIDGTGSHLLLEMCLQNNVRADTYDMQIIGANHHDSPNGWLVDKERAERVQMCLDYVTRRVKELQNQHPGCSIKVEAESKSDPGAMFGRSDWWGTVDITITVTNKHGHCMFIEVIDYKDGRGFVSEKDNTQLLSYLTGRMRPYVAAGQHIKWVKNVAACRVTIVQPKTNPVVRYEEPTPESVIERAKELARAAEATDDPNAPLIPDDKGGKGYCRWCKHKPNCTAQSGTAIEAVKTMTNEVANTGDQPLFEVLENAVANIESIPDEKLADLFDTEAAVQAIYDKIKKEVQRRVELGHEIPGYAMEPGKGSNKWNCKEEEVVKVLKSCRLKKDVMYPPTLISPAQARKLELTDKQKEKIEGCISYVAGKPTLKKVARKKVEAQSAEMLFASVPKEESYPSLFDNVPEENVGQSSDTVAESNPEVSFF